MPILGIMASQISGHLYTLTGSYDSLATVTVPSGGVASVTFAGIPTGYRHLQIRAIGRTTNAGTEDQVQIQFNGDTSSANYAFHSLNGNGSAASAYGYGTGVLSGISPVLRCTGSAAISGAFGASTVNILDYASTNKYKTTRTLTGYDRNGAGEIQLNSGLWLSAAAITSMTMTIQGGGNFAEYSSFALYGVK